MNINLSRLEKKLIRDGIKSFTMSDKNQLIAEIANKDGKAYYEITEDYLLQHHKKIKTGILSDTCEEKVVSGFTSFNGNLYRTNRDDQSNFMGKMIQLMNDDTITSVMWKTENVGYISHTRADWIKVYNEALNHKESTLFKYNDLKTQVANAITDDEVLLVSWS